MKLQSEDHSSVYSLVYNYRLGLFNGLCDPSMEPCGRREIIFPVKMVELVCQQCLVFFRHQVPGALFSSGREGMERAI